MTIAEGSDRVETGAPPPRKRLYVLATLCLAVGVTAGYFALRNRSTGGTALPVRGAPATNSAYNRSHTALTLDQMKRTADAQAATLLERLNREPKNAGLLTQIAAIYQAAHQFREASVYFGRALEIDPKNVSARTQLASCLYYSGDVDGALSQLDEALRYSPGDKNALFNLGAIKYQGKNDPAGAVTAWQRLLQTNPDLDRRALVEQLIAQAKAAER